MMTPSPLTRLALLLIRGYQLVLSPFVGQQCRFWPSCSEYTREALEKHGFVKGTTLGVKRICRCHPWHEGGCDPVPDVSAIPKQLPPSNNKV